jgi:hypothetical protein
MLTPSAAKTAPAAIAPIRVKITNFFIVPPHSFGNETTNGCVFSIGEAKFSDNTKERKSLLDIKLALLFRFARQIAIGLCKQLCKQ